MMVSATPLVRQPVPQPVGEQRVVLRSLTWQGYLAMRQSLSPDRNTRLTYCEGTLEITMPLEVHEFSAWLIGRFIYILASELGMDTKTMGSTTLDRAGLNRSGEPDAAYYIQNQALVAGRTVDLETDPPPDLVVEVDITSRSKQREKVYCILKIPELWCFDGQRLTLLGLQDDTYVPMDCSLAFPQVDAQSVEAFLQRAMATDYLELVREFREWLRSL